MATSGAPCLRGILARPFFYSQSPLGNTRPRLSLTASLLIAIAAVSTASILIRFAQRDAPSLTIAALRLTFAAVLLFPFAITRYRVQLRSLKSGEVLLAALAGIFLAVHFGTWISSLEYTSVASSVVLVSTGPIWVALLSPIFLGERLARAALFGLSLAVLGGIVIGAADACSWGKAIHCASASQVLHGRALYGDLLALVGALAVSGYLILGRRLRANVELVPYIFLVYGFAAITLLAAVASSHEAVGGFQPETYAWILLLAIVPQMIGHSTYNWALRFLPAAFVAVVNLGEPIGSAILAYLILRERPGPFVVLGGILVLGGIYLAARGVQGRADLAPS